MRTFEDKDGTKWGVRITRAVLRDVRKATGVLLTDIALDDFTLMKQICGDPLLAGDILWEVCREQAKDRDVNQTGFETATDGDCFEPAVVCLIEGIADFFPKPQRGLLLQMIQAGKDSTTEQIPMLETLIPLTQKEMTRKLQDRIDELTRSTSTTDSPESSE